MCRQQQPEVWNLMISESDEVNECNHSSVLRVKIWWTQHSCLFKYQDMAGSFFHTGVRPLLPCILHCVCMWVFWECVCVCSTCLCVCVACPLHRTHPQGQRRRQRLFFFFFPPPDLLYPVYIVLWILLNQESTETHHNGEEWYVCHPPEQCEACDVKHNGAVWGSGKPCDVIKWKPRSLLSPHMIP